MNTEFMNTEKLCQYEPQGGWSSLGSVVPVLSVKKLDYLGNMLESLSKGGVKSIEITLRTPIALDAIRTSVKDFPELLIGAGTVMTAQELEKVIDTGAKFALSPGLLPDVVRAANNHPFPFIPGVATASEVMLGLQLGVTHFKLFPAMTLGGAQLLNAFNGPMPQARFCPTGGVQPENMLSLLNLPNVYAVGMTKLVPDDFIERQNWSGLTDYVKKTLELAVS